MTRLRTRRPARPRVHHRWWHAPLPTWPGAVDHLADSWWRLPPRVRLLLGLLGVAVLVLGVVRHSSTSPWGPPTPVLVAEADVEPGRPVTARVRDWPSGLVPEDALRTLPDDDVATRPIRAGEVLVRTDLVGDLDDLLRAGEVAVAVGQDLPDLPADAKVVVLGTGFDGTGRRLASGRLVATTSEWTWIAIDSAAAPGVAAALSTGQVTLALDAAG